MTERLAVYIAGSRAGELLQGDSGELSFSYEGGYSGVPLSLSMPVSNRTFGDKVVRPYFMGLLPDDPVVRRDLGRRLGVSGENPFALLEHVGLDCPGAVQVCDEGLANPSSRGDGLVEVSATEIAARLSEGRSGVGTSWETDRERWSLGGQQTKFALRKEGDRWFSCEGSAPTTHIIKPGISGLRLEALNEYLCLRLARACDIPSACAEYVVFDGQPAIVVERYDRMRDPMGNVVRLHQEDLCQALGVLPHNKYPEDGGPSASDVIRLLRRTGAPAASNVAAFVGMLFFNYLVAAPDAHAKNYSLLLDRGAAYLAPLYDVASALPYVRRWEGIKLAMGIAGENRVSRLSARRLARFARANDLEDFGLGPEVLAEMLADLAQRIPPALEAVVGEDSRVPGVDELGERLLRRVGRVCSTSMTALG